VQCQPVQKVREPNTLLGLITNPDFLDTFGHPGTGFLGIIGMYYSFTIV
jgi:hypothetical protein